MGKARGWERLAEHDFDLFVIGAGSGGVRAARMSAAYGARVAIAEERYLGGTCVNVGCVPKKLFVYGAHFAEDFEDAAGFGWNGVAPTFDWPVLRDNKTREIERLNGIYHNLLTGPGVEVIEARARLTGPHTIDVDGREVSAERILVATGSWPVLPPFPGVEHAITSNEAFYLDRFPERVLVVGGGYIAVEFAGIFQGLGAEARLSYRGDLFLRGFDAGIRRFVLDEVRAKGVEVSLNSRVARLDRHGEEFVTTFEDGSKHVSDLVMVATGRAPNTEGLGLDAAGVQLAESGAIPVDDEYRTNVPPHSCHWRRDRSHAADAGSHRRGHVHRRQPLQRRVAPGGLRQCTHRHLLPAQHRHGGADGGGGEATLSEASGVRVELPTHEAHPLRSRRTHDDEALGGRRPAMRSWRRTCAGRTPARSSRALPSPSSPVPPRSSSIPRWAFTPLRPRSS